ncbi:uncharacterized protein LOC123678797 isoform X5 [Harmonia axyridis]|uniref:uncharacterized protein LOC123678797 isoform X5 n=1 Tax=Harmonia axyridis TaxID=115357 RepID=UPI001E279CFF|nr:uncharacterized protein LOC123678797 isoform X5 [Harmonia axyridis]
MTETKDEEQVVMTPKGKTANSTTLIIERKKIQKTDERMHVAGGQHTGIVINKEAATENGTIEPAHLSLEFRVFLVSAQTGKHTQESRTLRFWFRAAPDTTDHPSEDKQASVAQEFFKELVSPKDFPRDYVGFIKKIMKLMQHNYKTIKMIEVELKQLEGEAVPVRPLSAEEPLDNIKLLTVEKVLDLIESAYPNPITIQDVANDNGWDQEEVAHHLAELQSRNLVKNLEHGAFTRQQSQDVQVTIVKQMPTMASSKQPTIAIITAQYCEKLAVDAMIENKETFVRYTTVGESNVYTLGNIGAHRIVCTKLPSVGHTREAMTAAGNTTTRLLGTFQKVDYVFLVGAGGGVPHYTDYNKHVRLGDVVVSYPSKDKNIYFYCEKANLNEKEYDFEYKSYRPNNLNLQDIAANLKSSAANDTKVTPPWVKYIQGALNILRSSPEPDFRPPSSDTDKLYMNIGNKDIIEVAHPLPQDKSVRRQEGCPRIHLGSVASGRQIVKEDVLRQKFAAKMGVLSFDSEFDAVIESILGNCKDSFICIRGISDYKDGTRQKEWQPYASLAAASVMKAIICSMEAPTNV